MNAVAEMRLCCVIAIALSACAPSETHATPCDSLATRALPATTITSAQIVASGAFLVPPTRKRPSPEIFNAFDRLPAFCRVQATLAPSNDSRIKVEVWMPTSNWNGRYLGVGNGGYAGTIAYPRLGEAVNSGYASASTDTGHEGVQTDTSWARGHPEKRTDFDYRAIHEMTRFAKAMISAFYDKPATYSYFSSCSNGGRQGLMEAERYPEDYDGIMSGAPAFHWGFETFLSGQLDAFRNRHGKVVIYHGSKDAPEGTIDYYQRLVSRFGQNAVDDFVRLYIVSGMGHCGSGVVPNDFGQWIRPNADASHSIFVSLERWVEANVAPQSIIATQWRVDGDPASGLVRTRPLCPYPRQARLAGGNANDAINYVCK